MFSRLSSVFFLLALAAYYLPKAFKRYNTLYRMLHIVMGSLSAGLMLVMACTQIGTPSGMKYIGFAIIMIGISITGIGILKNKLSMRKLHIISTLGFFVYLAGIIIL
ncbi:MAG: hypothetical protein RR915_04625 [Cellulosilyticaceae bacterium]